MKMRIETTSVGFMIRSTSELMNLRSAYQDHVIHWSASKQADMFTYTLMTADLIDFFAESKPVTASIVFDDTDGQHEVSVQDIDLSFGEKLYLTDQKNTMTAYVSLKATLRIGWNWFGATAAITDEHTITKYRMTAQGLLVDVRVQTKFFKPIALDMFVIGTFLARPLSCTVTQMESVQDNGVFTNTMQVLVPLADFLAMRKHIQKHGMGQTTFEFKFKLQIAEYPLTKETLKWTVDKEMVLANPLLEVPSTENADEDFVLATRVSKQGNLMFILAAIDAGTYADVRQQLLDTQITTHPTKTVLLDQGAPVVRQNMRILFRALRAASVADVYLLTDGQVAETLPYEHADHIIYAHSKEHVWVYPQIKTLIVMGNRHDALPLGAQSVIPVSIKHHVVLVDDLLKQIETQAFNFPTNGPVDFVVANKQMRSLVKQVYPTRTTTHLVGLPLYDVFEEQAATSVATQQIGLCLTAVNKNAVQALAGQDVVAEVTMADNLRAYTVIISDDYEVVLKASSLGVPVVYLQANLTAEGVDHYYHLAGPVIRDVLTGKAILERVLSGRFDFSAYLEHAENNLNQFHDAQATQRIINLLQNN